MPQLTFKEMNNDLSLIVAKCQLLLGLPEVEFKETTYALFFILEGSRSELKHTTRHRKLIEIGAWIRFLKGIVSELPEGNAAIIEARKEIESLEIKYPEERRKDVQHSHVE